MKTKRIKDTLPAPPALAEISGNDRDLLTNAYKIGLIVGWKQDRERGYRLTLGDRRDEYVEITKLSSYLERLRKSSPDIDRGNTPLQWAGTPMRGPDHK